MGFTLVGPNYRDHDEEWVRAQTNGGLALSRAVVDRWFADTEAVLFMVDTDTNRVVVMPETNSADDEDTRKLTCNESGYANVSFGGVCNEFGFSAQDIDESVYFDVEENGHYDAPMFDMTELVDEYASE